VAELELSLLSNTRDFQRGTKDAADALEGVSDALDEAVRDGEKAGEKLERTFKEIATTAQRESKKMGDSFAREAPRGMSKAGEAAKEFKTEAIQNFSEVTSSFRGDLTSIGDLVQGTFGGVAAGISGISLPAAIVAGSLGAVVGGALSAIAADSETMKETVSTNFDEMAQNGIAAWSSVEGQQQRLRDAYKNHEEEIKRIAETVGLPFETVAAAWAGNEDAIRTFRAAQDDLYESAKKFESDNPYDDLAESMRIGWDNVLAPLNKQLDAYDQATDKVERLQEQIDQLAREDRANTKRSQDADAARWKALEDAYEHAAQLPPIQIKTEIQEPDVNALVSSLQGQLRGKRIVIRVDGETRDGQVVP
jgi:hypothetical protein